MFLVTGLYESRPDAITRCDDLSSSRPFPIGSSDLGHEKAAPLHPTLPTEPRQGDGNPDRTRYYGVNAGSTGADPSTGADLMTIYPKLRLYDYAKSGNAYKVRLLLGFLGLGYERVQIDVLKAEARAAAFVSKNPVAKVPLLELSDGRVLSESNAILFFLADGTKYLPDDRWRRAQVLQWQSFEATSHQPYIGVVRFWHIAGTIDENRDSLAAKLAKGHRALQIMEDHLSKNDYFVGGACSIADISLYAYTHVAHEGGFDLKSYRSIQQWLERIEQQPGHSPIDE